MRFVLSPAFISLILVFASALWMLRDESDRTRVLLFFGLLINVVYGSVQSALMGAMNGLLPWKYDYILYGLDTALGVSAPAIARSAMPAVLIVLTIAYELMVPAMILLYVFGAGKEQRRDVAVAYFAEMVFGPLLYVLLPACGPMYVFHSVWPHVQAHPALQPVKLGGMPNAFPSLHFATAIVLLVFARPGKWRLMAAAFVAVTAVATITTGEHYVIDLVAGIVFACFAAYAGRRRYKAAAFFLGFAALSAVLIRFYASAIVAHPILLREVVIATCVLCTVSLGFVMKPNSHAHASKSETQRQIAQATGTS